MAELPKDQTAWDLYCELVQMCPTIHKLRNELRDMANEALNSNKILARSDAYSCSELTGTLDMLDTVVSHAAICIGVKFRYPGANYTTGIIEDDTEYRKRPENVHELRVVREALPTVPVAEVLEVLEVVEELDKDNAKD